MDTPKQKPTLEEKLQKIRELLGKGKGQNAWEIGNEFNEIKRYRLAWEHGFRSARDCLKQEFGNHYKPQTIYRYARVAKHFSREVTLEFRVHKLDALIARQKRAHGRVTGPEGYEIQVTQEDGSMITKKFKDCRVRELRPKTTKQAKTRAKSGAGNAPRPALLAWAFTLIFVGSMAALGADFVQWSSVGQSMRRLGPLLDGHRHALSPAVHPSEPRTVRKLRRPSEISDGGLQCFNCQKQQFPSDDEGLRGQSPLA